jgi:DNA helicase-2/ATP-dependent DNA helicase PcrA
MESEHLAHPLDAAAAEPEPVGIECAVSGIFGHSGRDRISPGATSGHYHALMRMSGLLADLNESQREAVTHPGGPLLVLAGAGSGKTRVITRRIAWLASKGTGPEHVLALTFSTKAAEEMRGRAEELLSGAYEELSCATFHSFCAQLLREEGLDAGLDPFFTTLTPAERLALLLDQIDELTLRHHLFWGNPAALLAKLIERIDRLKDEMVTASDYEVWARSHGQSSNGQGDDGRVLRELEFARFYSDHDRLLADSGALDFGELILRAFQLLRERPAVRERISARFQHVLVDEYQDTNFAQGELMRLLVGEHRNIVVVGDDDQSIYRFRGASRKNIADFQTHFPDAKLVLLETNYRSTQPILDAAHAVVVESKDRLPKKLVATNQSDDRSVVRFWRCENERAQSQAVAAELESLIAGGADPAEAAVLVRSARHEGAAVAAALEERGIPFKVTGAGGFFERAEVRDLLAWLRLLDDPNDASAVVRALIRPPFELSPVDLARATQTARRRRVDMVSALMTVRETEGTPPDACERIEGFLRLYRSAARAFEEIRPDLFLHRLIDRLGLRKQQLFVADRASLERLVNIAKFEELSAAWSRQKPRGTTRDFARYVVAAAEAGLREEEASVPAASGGVQIMTMHGAKGLEFDHVYVLGLSQGRMPGSRRGSHEPVPDALLKETLPADTREAHIAEMRRLLYVAMTRARQSLVLAWPETSASGEQTRQKPSPFYEEARAALSAEEEERGEELLGPGEDLLATFRDLREEVIGDLAQIGSLIGEMRLDAHLDAVRATSRYLELLKLAALMERPPGQDLGEAIADLNRLLLEGASAQQREGFITSDLDERVLAVRREKTKRRGLIAKEAQQSLEAFIPMRGDGVMLSATDIEIYKICPLRYKYARVYSIPREQTLRQRFGILVHQVLERFHTQLADSPPSNGDSVVDETGGERLLTLFEHGWRRSGFGDTDEERQLHEKAVTALGVYHENFRTQDASPVWFERNFAFHIGNHLLRGRVDRVDRHTDGSYELIDYKTGRAKTASQLKDDVQLSLYQIGAKESWKLDASRQSYYYVLDNEQVPLEPGDEQVLRVRDTVVEVAERIRSQDFGPTPSWSACSTCDFRIICPVAER